MPVLSLRVECWSEIDVVVARGDLDIDTHEQLRALRDTAFTRPVLVLDMLGVGFIDSLGVGALVVLRRSAERRGARTVLVADGLVARLVRIAGLDELMPVVASWDELPARGRHHRAPDGGRAEPVAPLEPPVPPRRDEARLAALLVEVRRARAAFDAERTNPPALASRERVTALAGRVARAMHAYADTAATVGIPLPYRYRDQLRLYRALAADAGASEPLRAPGTPLEGSS